MDYPVWDVAEAITPSDTDELASCVGLHCQGAAGDVVVRFGTQATDGTDIDATFYFEKGQDRLFPGGVKQVRATSTTATGIVGLYTRLES